MHACIFQKIVNINSCIIEIDSITTCYYFLFCAKVTELTICNLGFNQRDTSKFNHQAFTHFCGLFQVERFFTHSFLLSAPSRSMKRNWHSGCSLNSTLLSPQPMIVYCIRMEAVEKVKVSLFKRKMINWFVAYSLYFQSDVTFEKFIKLT